MHLLDFLRQWCNHLGPSESHGNVWTLIWSKKRYEQSGSMWCLHWLWCLVGIFAAVVSWCSAGVYPLRSCRVVTASEHPSLPGRSSMLPQSGCLSKRTSASVRDTGRKHLCATHTYILLMLMQSFTYTNSIQYIFSTQRRTHGGISPTKGTERGEGGARVGVRVLRLDLSFSTTSLSICSWPGSNVRLDGTFSYDQTEQRIC